MEDCVLIVSCYSDKEPVNLVYDPGLYLAAILGENTACKVSLLILTPVRLLNKEKEYLTASFFFCLHCPGADFRCCVST